MESRYLPRVTVLLAAIVATWAAGSHSAESVMWPVSFEDPSAEAKPEISPTAVGKKSAAADEPQARIVSPEVDNIRSENVPAFLDNKGGGYLSAAPETKRATLSSAMGALVQPPPRVQRAESVVAGADKPAARPLSIVESERIVDVTPAVVNASAPAVSKALSSMVSKAASAKPVSVAGGSVALAEAVRLAMNWHPTIKRAEREYAQSKESINEAKAGWYPSLSARIKSGMEQNNYNRKDDKSNALALTASQVIYDFGKTSSKVDLADATTHRSESNLDKSINDIAYETANAFVQAIRYQQMVDIARGQVEGVSAINDLAEKRATLGASAESDYSQSKVRLASAIAQMHDYEAQAYRWNSVLDNVTNQPISSALKRQFPDGMDAACYRVDAEHLTSPAITLAEAQIKMAKEQVKAFKAEYYPTISVNPTWEYELENRNDYRGHRANKSEWGIFVNVSAPLYEGGARMSRTQQAEQALLASQYNLDTEKTEARRKIVEATSQIASLRESLGAKRVREKESIRTRDLYKLQYLELGNRSFSDLLSAESEIHQTRMDILNSQFTVATLSLDCLYTSGNLVRYFTE